jgi:DNA-directed RNA polymerase specialized sigma24 family protein
VLLAIRPTRSVPGHRPATQKREEHSMEQRPVCLEDDHPSEPVKEVIARMVKQLEPSLRRKAASDGNSRHADDAISALWPELSGELDRGGDWAYCPRGVCPRRIAKRIRLRFTARIVDARGPDGRLVWLDAEVRADEDDGPTLAERLLAVPADSEFGSSTERAALQGERGEIESAVWRELARMPVAMRTAVVAHLDGATSDEIEHYLGVSNDNARQLVSRGLKRLRKVARPDSVT